MKNFKYLAISSFLALPALVSAGVTPALDTGGEAQGFLNSILTFINGTLIPFILGIAFLLFVWGMFQYFIAGGANEEAKEKGKSLLIYSILGFILIIVFWGIINLLANATGLNNETLDATNIPGVNVITP